MRLADDERARVPFALVGVVLLVGSATFAATMARQQVPADEPAAGPAIEKAKSSTHAAVAQAAEQAAREASRNPVVEPANASYGRVLNDSEPFRDYMRVRIYVAVQHALDDVETREGAVIADPSVPDVSNATELRKGKRRVTLEPVGDDRSAGLRVRIRNATVTASRGGQVLDRRAFTPTVVVSTPVLALHERTADYETRLNRGPLDGPGLGRRLTARTYALAWVRGYAQYGGTPIENVVANRHVELLTNGALLREQRRAFGHGDPDGRRAMGRATARVALTDLTAGMQWNGDRWVEYLFDRADGETPSRIRALSDPDVPRSKNATIGVNRSADVAFSAFVDGEGSPSLDTVLESVYSADVKLSPTVRQTEQDTWTTGRRPPENWTLVDEATETTVRVRSAPDSNGTSPPGWDRYRSYSRTVVRTEVTTKRWRKGDRVRETHNNRRATYRVTIDVLGNPAPRAPGPSRETDLYERGGPLDGPNMRDVLEKAVGTLVEDRGGPDELTRRAVDGSLDTSVETIRAERPDGLSAWVYADLARLRERVGNASVEVDRRSVAMGQQRPAGLLGRELRDRRMDLIDAPERYDGAAERARIAARAAYLDRVGAQLDERSQQSRTVRQNFEGALGRADLPSLDRIERISAARNASTPERSNLHVAGPDREMAVSVEADPSYLTLAAVNASSVRDDGRYHPLVARNVNGFTLPYGDVADEVVDGLFAGFDSRRVDLGTAARTLQGANRTLQERDDDELAVDRDQLHADVDESMERVRHRLASSLADEPGLDYRTTRAAIDEGLGGWNGTAERALAVSNGSAATPIAEAVVERLPPGERTDRRRDWITLRIRLDLTALTKQERVRPPERPANRTASRTREVARTALTNAVEDGLENAAERAKERWFGEALSSVPAGLPVTPIPGQWYATVNVWHVEVGGTYEQFAVRARHGSPTTGPVEYTRANRTVEFDADGDGDPERFGRNERVSFRTETVVLVAVPPGGSGVGDVDGDADERSDGWSERSDNP